MVLIFKKDSTNMVDVVAMELSAGASSPSMLARGMRDHCTVFPNWLWCAWQSLINLGIEMIFLCDFPCPTIF